MLLRALGSMCLAAAAAAQTYFPPPPAPATNPMTPNKVLLGMALFYEEQMSSTGTVACATCHDLQRGGIDNRTSTQVNKGPDGMYGTADDQHGSAGVAPIGITGTVSPHGDAGFAAQVTKRRAPTVVNAGYHTRLGLEGNRASLEELIAVPPVNSVEMAHVGRTWTQVAQKIAASTPLVFASSIPQRLQTFIAGNTYPQLFQLAFGSVQVTQQRIIDAIACYVRTLNSDQSKWDLHLNGLATLTAQEQLGLSLFTSPANGATSCHTCHGDFEQRVLVEGPVAGQMTMTTSGPYGSTFPSRLLFHNVGVRPIAEDPGVQLSTGLTADGGKFRVASLRNVELTAPYFHNGSKATLRDVLDFYDRGGDFHTNQAANLTTRNYTVPEKDAIIALLKTLTDPRLAQGLEPFDRPRLGSETASFVLPIGEGENTGSGTLEALAPFAPRLGESWFTLTLSGATVGTPVFLMFDTAPGTGPYNLQLAMSPSFSMFLIGLAQAYPPLQGGYAQAPLPLPANPALSGQFLFFQWLSLEPSRRYPMATSNALAVQLR